MKSIVKLVVWSCDVGTGGRVVLCGECTVVRSSVKVNLVGVEAHT